MPEASTVCDALARAWDAVREDVGEEFGHYSRRVFNDSGLSIFVALKEPDGLLELAFEVAPDAIKSLRLAQTSRGFEVEVETDTNAAGAKVSRVCVRLTRKSFYDLFTALAADVVERLIGAPSEKAAMEALHARLEHWRRFSERVGPEGLELHQQTGLFGELLFLKDILDDGVPASKAVTAWHGPLRENQDFGFGKTAAEVKTTTSNTPMIVTITNERQLDSSGLENLYLFHVSLERREEAGTSLPEAIENLASRLSEAGGEVADVFESRLLILGYHYSQSDLYRTHGYTERSRSLYEVADGFPRIVEGDLPDGVSGVRYRLDLAAAGAYRVESAIVFAAVQGD